MVGKVTPRASVARIFLSRKGAKPQRRREGNCLFPFLCAFAPLREPHRHLPPTVTLNLFVLCTPSAPGSISRLYPSVRVARWMLNRVAGNAPLRPPRLCVNPLICHSRESGNPWAELSAKWFAQRHEGTKRLLRVFVSSCEPKSCRARTYQTMGSRFRGNDKSGRTAPSRLCGLCAFAALRDTITGATRPPTHSTIWLRHQPALRLATM
jgi:hypothetical protein